MFYIVTYVEYIYRSPMISSEISPSGPEASKATRAWWSSQPPIARTSWIRRWCDRAASIDRFRQETDLGQDDLLNLEIALLGGPSPSFLVVEHSKTCPTRFFCMSNGICWPSAKGSTGKMFMETGESLWV